MENFGLVLLGVFFFFGFFFSFSSSNCLVPLVFGLAKKKKGRKSKIGNATQVRSVRPRWNLSGQSRKMSLNNNDINSIMIRTETPTDRWPATIRTIAVDEKKTNKRNRKKIRNESSTTALVSHSRCCPHFLLFPGFISLPPPRPFCFLVELD